MLRILVLGLNGLIGWNLYKEARKSASVFGTYRTVREELKHESCSRLDMLDLKALSEYFGRVNPHYLIHAWAMCDLDVCESEPDIARRVNVEGTRRILEAAGRLPELRKFVYISTDHVFDGENGNYPEEHAPCPKHVYGCTKAEAEKLVRESPLKHLIIRPGLIVGRSLQGNKGPRDFLVSRILARKPTHYFTDELRSPVRAEAFAAECIRLMLSRAGGIRHIAGTDAVSRYVLARKIAWENRLPVSNIFPRKRSEDKWAHIRPGNLSLLSNKIPLLHSF